MTTQPTRTYTKLALAIILVGVMVSVSLFAAVNLTAKTATVTITLTFPDSLIYSNVTDGIQLSALIQPTGQVYGGNFTIVAVVRDVLSTNIQLNASALDNPVYGPCEQAFATGVNVYSGRYNSSNISQATPLLFYNPSLPILCPAGFPQHYSFSPGEDVTETSVISGYWTGSGQDYTYTKTLPPGLYTVVVFDAWNQTAIGYIQSDYPAP